jgi:hypothetical protein
VVVGECRGGGADNDRDGDSNPGIIEHYFLHLLTDFFLLEEIR